MSRKNSILLIAVLSLLIIGGLIYVYFSNKPASTQDQTTTTNTTNPFGNTFTNKAPVIDNQTTNTTETTGTAKNLSELIMLYQNPTSGSLLFTNKNGQDSVRFVDRAKGHIYEYTPITETGEPTRLTNTTIPKIHESIWLNNGTSLVFRYLNNDTDNITSFLGRISTSTSADTPSEIVGSFITPNINQLVTNPAGNKIFRLLTKSNKSGTYGSISSSLGTEEKQVFDSPILYWNISWPKENTITFTTKPTYKYPGYLFFFNPQTGSMDRILGGMLGLSTVTNNDGSMVAYSISNGNSFAFDIYDVKNKTNKGYDVNTLADKCVWGIKNPNILYCAIPNEITGSYYPDAWYQGVVSFVDNIWSINTNTGEIKLVYQIGLKENAEIDVYDLKISPSDEYMTFSNKNDLSFWLLKIKN